MPDQSHADLDNSAIPPDNGAPATVDPRTGEVRGSGVGAGGGSVGEDPSSDPEAGDGQPEGGIAPPGAGQ